MLPPVRKLDVQNIVEKKNAIDIKIKMKKCRKI